MRAEPAILPYRDVKINRVKKVLHLDDNLLREAKASCGAATDTETVRLGLEALVCRPAYQRLRAFLGSEPLAHDVPRRREKPARKQKPE